MTKTTLKVTGMSCKHCVHAVSSALGSLEGVRSADVDLDAGRAVVVYDEARVGPGQMVGAVMEEGYPAEEIPA